MGDQGFFIGDNGMKRLQFTSWLMIGLLTGRWLNAAGSSPEVFRAEPFNLARVVGDADVLLVADDHTQPEIKNFLGDHLQALKTLGFQTIGIEMLPAHCQKDLDSWDAASHQRIRRHLEEFWGEKGDGIPDAILRLVEEAKRQRLTVIAIDSDGLSDTDQRSAYWVEDIERCRKDKDGSRIIVFGGASHFRGDSGTVLSLLKAHGVRVSVLEFSGLEDSSSVDLEWKVAQALQRAIPGVVQVARENDRQGRHGLFMVSSAPDWVINLEPQTKLALLSYQR